VDRPVPIPPGLAGHRQLGGWIDPRGRFYPAAYCAHIRVAFLLRETGEGPAEPWLMAESWWAMVKSHGEVIARPDRLSQAQLDSLSDMLMAAPDGPYRSSLLASLRQLRELEMCRRG